MRTQINKRRDGHAMRRFVAIAMASVIAIAGCGGDDDDRAATLPDLPTTIEAVTTTEAAAGPVGDDELRAKLLTVADLPSGYSVMADDEEDEDDEDDFCEDAFKELESIEGFEAFDDESEEISVQFQKGEPSIMGGAFVLEALGSGDSKTIAAVMDALPGAFANCREITSTDEDGTTFKGSFTPLSFTQVGDQTFAMHMSGEISNPEGFNFPMSGDMVFVREESIVMMVFGFGFGATNVPVAELEQIVKTAHGKL